MSGGNATKARGEMPLRFRASWHVIGGRISLGMGVTTVSAAVVVVLLQAQRLEDTWQWVAVVGGLAFAALWVVTYVATAEVTVTSEHVTKRRWWIWRTRLRRARVYGLAAPLRQPLERRVFPLFFLREHDEQGRGAGPRIKLSSWYWKVEDLRRIAELLQLPLVEEAIDAAEFERRAPGALSLRHRRPVLWAFGLVFGGGFTLFWVLFFLIWFSS